MQMLLDGYASDVDFLTDISRIDRWIRKVAVDIGMNPVAEPYIVTYGEGCGVTAFLALGYRESHIVLHTWPEERIVQLDCFSCKKFNAAIILGSICKEAQIPFPKSFILQRGVKNGELLPMRLRLGVQPQVISRESEIGGKQHRDQEAQT